jgi:KDO2-lipid IV(A) lauroyltransferase
VERAVLEHPEQWLWVHKRWKTRPPGEKPAQFSKDSGEFPD